MTTYLFDFDGTLVDSMPAYASCMCKILDDHQIPYSEELLKTITPLGFKATAKYYVELGVPLSEQAIIDRILEYLIHDYTYNVPAKNNVISVLKELKNRGHNLNILTASPHDTLDPCLKRLGIYELFTNVWSCNDFGKTKSDPEIYRMAAAAIGVDVKDVIFLDDNYNADKTAKEAGMIVYGVYDDTSKEYTEEIKSITDNYIVDFSELL